MPVMQEDTYQITIVYYLELDHISFYLCSTTSEKVCFFHQTDHYYFYIVSETPMLRNHYFLSFSK